MLCPSKIAQMGSISTVLAPKFKILMGSRTSLRKLMGSAEAILTEPLTYKLYDTIESEQNRVKV